MPGARYMIAAVCASAACTPSSPSRDYRTGIAVIATEDAAYILHPSTQTLLYPCSGRDVCVCSESNDALLLRYPLDWSGPPTTVASGFRAANGAAIARVGEHIVVYEGTYRWCPASADVNYTGVDEQFPSFAVDVRDGSEQPLDSTEVRLAVVSEPTTFREKDPDFVSLLSDGLAYYERANTCFGPNSAVLPGPCFYRVDEGGARTLIRFPADEYRGLQLGDFVASNGALYVAGNCVDRDPVWWTGDVPCGFSAIYRVSTTGEPGVTKVASVADLPLPDDACGGPGALVATPAVRGDDLYFTAVCAFSNGGNRRAWNWSFTVYVAAVDGSRTPKRIYAANDTITGLTATDDGVLVCGGDSPGQLALIPRDGGPKRVIADVGDVEKCGSPVWSNGTVLWLARGERVYRATTRL